MKSSIKISNRADEATPRPWQISPSGDVILNSTGSKKVALCDFHESPLLKAEIESCGVKANAALIVKAVNQFEALNDVANSVQKFKDAQSAYLKRESSSELFDAMCFAESCMFTALANWEAVRKEGK